MDQLSDNDYNQIIKDFDSYGKVLLETYHNEEGKVKKEKAFLSILNYFKIYENRKGVKNLSPKEKEFLNEIAFIIEQYEKNGGTVFHDDKTFLNTVSNVFNQAAYHIPTAMATAAVVFAAYQLQPNIVSKTTPGWDWTTKLIGAVGLGGIVEPLLLDKSALLIGSVLTSAVGVNYISSLAKYLVSFFSAENAQDEKYLQMIRERKERFLANK